MLISQGLNICNLWSVIYILLLAIRMHNQSIDTTLNVLSASDAGFVGRSAVHLFLSFSIISLRREAVYSPPRLAAHFLWSKLCRSHRCLCYLHLGSCTFLFMSPLWSVPERSSSRESHYPLPEQCRTARALRTRDSALAGCLLINFKAQSTWRNGHLGGFSHSVPTGCLAIRWRLMSFRELSPDVYESQLGFNIWVRKPKWNKTIWIRPCNFLSEQSGVF